MGLPRRSSPLALLLALLAFAALFAGGARAQLGGGGKKKPPPARKEDVPLIRCAVCEQAAKALSRQYKAKKDAATRVKPLTELAVIEAAEKICDPESEEGEWLTQLDLVEEGDTLAVRPQEGFQACNVECRTAVRACEEVMGEHDTDVAEALFSEDLERSKLTTLLCKKMSKACKRPAPEMPKGRAVGTPFTPKDEKTLEMERMMRKMKASMPEGMGGGLSMHSREDLMDYYDGDDGEYDDEDDEASFNAKARRAFKAAGGKEGAGEEEGGKSWLQKGADLVRFGLESVGDTIAKGVLWASSAMESGQGEKTGGADL